MLIHFQSRIEQDTLENEKVVAVDNQFYANVDHQILFIVVSFDGIIYSCF